MGWEKGNYSKRTWGGKFDGALDTNHCAKVLDLNQRRKGGTYFQPTWEGSGVMGNQSWGSELESSLRMAWRVRREFKIMVHEGTGESLTAVTTGSSFEILRRIDNCQD